MVVVDLDGKLVEGHYKPSLDTPTHLALYKEYDIIKSVIHTHSEWAKMVYRTERINQNSKPIRTVLLNKYYLRKHGKNAYYGQ